jgi:hypothetical protein
MDKIIANGKQLKLRQLIVGFLTAVACGAGVYLFHVPFHTLLLDVLGTSSRIADLVESFSIVLISVAVNNTISLVIFKDISLGIRAEKQQPGQQQSGNEDFVLALPSPSGCQVDSV